MELNAEQIFGDRKYDHKILNAALGLQKEFPKKKVILVTKDICLRLKAKALNLPAEDYQTGKIKDLQKLYSGKTVIEKVGVRLIDRLFERGSLEPEMIGIDEPQVGLYK